MHQVELEVAERSSTASAPVEASRAQWWVGDLQLVERRPVSPAERRVLLRSFWIWRLLWIVPIYLAALLAAIKPVGWSFVLPCLLFALSGDSRYRRALGESHATRFVGQALDSSGSIRSVEAERVGPTRQFVLGGSKFYWPFSAQAVSVPERAQGFHLSEAEKRDLEKWYWLARRCETGSIGAFFGITGLFILGAGLGVPVTSTVCFCLYAMTAAVRRTGVSIASRLPHPKEIDRLELLYVDEKYKLPNGLNWWVRGKPALWRRLSPWGLANSLLGRGEIEGANRWNGQR